MNIILSIAIAVLGLGLILVIKAQVMLNERINDVLKFMIQQNRVLLESLENEVQEFRE